MLYIGRDPGKNTPNTYLGYSAILNTTGSYNIGIGYSSGSEITTGNSNVVIGGYTGFASPINQTGSNWIVLSDGAGTVRQVINGSGNVGISTTNPLTQLDLGTSFYSGTPVALDQAINKICLWNNGSPVYGLGISTAMLNITAGESGSSIVFRTGTSATERVRIDNNGNVGVNTTAPSNFSGWGSISLNGSTGGRLAFQSNGTLKQSVYNVLDDFYINNGQNGSIILATNNTTQAFLNSTGTLSIGTSTVTSNSSQKLVLYGSAVSNTVSSLYIQNSTTGAGSSAGFAITVSGNNTSLWNYSNGYIQFGVNNVERASIDTSGNFTIGAYNSSSVRTGISGCLFFDGAKTVTDQYRGIYWTAFDKEGSGDYTDTAYIRQTVNTGGLSGSVLEIASNNDANDGVNVVTQSITGFKHNGNTVWNAANLTNLNQLANGPGYITGYTEVDTLGTVTARGATTGTNCTFTGNVALTTGTISTTPTSTNDIVNKSYVDSVANGINFHPAVNYGTTAALGSYTYNNGTNGVGATLTGPASTALTIDGYTFTSTDVDNGTRVLIKNETGNYVNTTTPSAAFNGVYVVSQINGYLGATAWKLTRTTDFDTAGSGQNEINTGDFMYVASGTTNANTSWIQQTNNVTVGTSNIVFIQFGAATSPGGSTGSIQYNTGSAFTGSNTFLYSNGTVALNTNSLLIADSNAATSNTIWHRLIVTGGGGWTNYGVSLANSNGGADFTQWGENSASKRIRFNSILGAYSSNTAGSEISYLSFNTMINGTLAERARFNSGGGLGIGTNGTKTYAKLHVADVDNACILIEDQGNGTGYLSQIGTVTNLAGEGAVTISTGASFSTGPTAATERLRISTTGALGLNGGNYGTSGQVLTSQGSSSPPIWQSASTGSGTTGKIAKFTSTTALGDSIITESGSTITIAGSLFATSKSFLIDHPTKEGMKLRYGSLEGPENGVYVRGRLNGNNVIELPEYWSKLVDPSSITVNLTPIGKHQNLYVEDIRDIYVYISNDQGDVNCFYTVYGERIDVEKLLVEF